MTSWHKETVQEIVKKLRMTYSLKYPFNLPEQKREKALYQPDIVVFDTNMEVKYIVEVQTRNVRKSIAGATILAEICLGIMKQDSRPTLFFVVKDDSEERELKKLVFRIDKIRESLKNPHLQKVQINRKTEFLRKIEQL